MATLKINGDTSGYVELVSPAVAGSTSLELDKIVVEDNSGNVLVGKTTNDFTLEGAIVRSSGEALFTRDGDTLTLNRLNTDGTHISLRKDDAAVGSIGVESTNLHIDGGSNKVGLQFRGAEIRPRDNGVNVDGTVDLGSSSNRFKDAYLSGGVYLGGTSSVNHLDDYEEGTWNPSYRNSATEMTYTMGNERAEYRKIGDTVWIHLGFRFTALSGTGTGAFRIYGLPFVAKSNGSYQEYRFSCALGNSVNSGNSYRVFGFSSNGNQILDFRIMDGGDTVFRSNEMDGNTFMTVWGFYVTA